MKKKILKDLLDEDEHKELRSGFQIGDNEDCLSNETEKCREKN